MSQHSGYPGAPPGWYPDPAGGPGQRWWDGYAWSEADRAPTASAAAAVDGRRAAGGAGTQAAPWAVASERLSTLTTTQRVDVERRMVPVARVAVAVPAVYFLVSLVLQRVNVDQLRSAGHQFRIDWHDAQHGITPPPYHAPSNSLRPGRTPRRRDHGGRGGRRLHLAAPGGIGRTRPRHPVPLLAGLGRRFVVRARRQPVDSLLRRTRLPPARSPTPAPRPALVDRLAPRRIPQHGDRCQCPVLDRDGPRAVHPRRARLPRRHRLGPRYRARDRRRPTRRPWPNRREEPGCYGAEPDPRLI